MVFLQDSWRISHSLLHIRSPSFTFLFPLLVYILSEFHQFFSFFDNSIFISSNIFLSQQINIK